MKKERLIFLDLMRAFAVMMMVQGHTTDVVLAQEYRTFESFGYFIWLTVRGFTAPIFMFTSGVVFTYLLIRNGQKFSENPRIKKGFKRFLLLVGVGYLLRYPTFTLIDFSSVTDQQWRIFFTVDALHLIGFGLLFVIITYYLSEKLRLPFYLTSGLAALTFIAGFPFTEKIEWINYLHMGLAGYMYKGTGSYFPFFPWAGYVLAGSMFGYFLGNHAELVKKPKFSFGLFSSGLGFLLLSFIIFEIAVYAGIRQSFWNSDYSLVFFRLGVVLLLYAVFHLFSRYLKNIPKLIFDIGKNTLPVYAAHLILLYGSAWNPGFYLLINKHFSLTGTIFAVLIMWALMVTLVYYIEKFKEKRKLKNALAPAEV
ncbi:MAG: DUF1624 domain-containing protein [Ignavibacteriales bacterium]|nr:DUF1624 domain-containing protein [Ignavibacteriales bacterium]MCF8316779.1 DUF1624 domain-containing protein [Ignavibacteriales bacterium]MCF8438083.1 DUF1624 domain-containing protein [Ignavibacteriales bacterium]